eukprot:CAMPEP_0202039380 /NCGR_PEP_ID=MMETSP0962-20130828/15846_1 /ASSEMBLY_ACC=CAM_ASM_000488 /TAXON_ID=4773 /ORGANISM="Schizochytrium aggregatum, Strain ATCC28209" /LENGTH=297 /DNA_ID=CAMNT_0048603591 /DNA_START=38 /DNA_END=933 /DNA_ORIENTATION=+
MTTAALRTVVPRIRRTGPLKATVAIAGRRWTASSGSWGVRLLYLIVVVSITGLALATPRTFARDADGALNANRVPFFWVLLALCITVFVFLQGSDPGFIEVAESGNARLELGAMVDIPLDDLSPRSPPTFGRVSHDEIYLRDLNCSREAGRDEDGATTSDDESENGASEEDEFELDLEPDERTDRQLAGFHDLHEYLCEQNSAAIVADMWRHSTTIVACSGLALASETTAGSGGSSSSILSRLRTSCALLQVASVTQEQRSESGSTSIPTPFLQLLSSAAARADRLPTVLSLIPGAY